MRKYQRDRHRPDHHGLCKLGNEIWVKTIGVIGFKIFIALVLRGKGKKGIKMFAFEYIVEMSKIGGRHRERRTSILRVLF